MQACPVAGLATHAGLCYAAGQPLHRRDEVIALSAMPSAAPKSSLFDFGALAAVPLQHDPFDFLVVPAFLKADALQAVNRDFPAISTPANFPPERLQFGPDFGRLLDELNGPEFQDAVGRKFGVDLTACSSTITVRKYCEASDGNIHTDHPSKVITVLLYFNEQWTDEGGKLRMLRSKGDIEDFAAEVPPLGGTLLAFRRSDHSFHGHRRFEGERRMLQMNWVRAGKFAQARHRLDRFSTHTMKRLLRLWSPAPERP